MLDHHNKIKSLILVEQKDGSVVPFNEQRIVSSLVRETGIPSSVASKIAGKVRQIVFSYGTDIKLTGPLVREVTCTVLLREGFETYRRKYTRVGMPLYDANAITNGFGKGDNANLQNSPETVHKRKADHLSKEQWLLTLPRGIADMHLRGDIHIHDLEYFGERQFCLDSDLRFFFYYGFVGDGTGTHTSYAGPAKRPEVAVMHAAKVLGCSQVCCAGGQGFYNFLCFLAPYFRGEDYSVYVQCMQMFVYEMTQMLVARGGQTVFSSVQLSPGIPETWRDIPAVYKGRIWDGKQAQLQTYGDFEVETRLLFKAIMEVMIEGDHRGKPFNFPKPEVHIAPEFVSRLDESIESPVYDRVPTYRELYLLSFHLAGKFGTPYFDNTIPKYRQTGGIECYQCCAYSFRSNLESDSNFADKLLFKEGAHFSMGSIQVITFNLPRIAYMTRSLLKETASDKLLVDMFVELCIPLFDVAIGIFKIKRKLIGERVTSGALPFLTQQLSNPLEPDVTSPMLVDFDALVNTVGVVGLNEVVKILKGSFMHESTGNAVFAINLCIALKQLCQQKSSESGLNLAFSRTPAETTAQRFAVMDLKQNFKGFVCQGDLEEAKRLIKEGINDCPIYYTNGTHISPSAPVPIAQRVQFEQAFFPVLDGGNIAHLWLGEKQPDARGLMEMAMNLCTKSNMAYFAFTRDFTMQKKKYTQYKPT